MSSDSGSFSGTGAGSSVATVGSELLTLSIRGTFTATIDLERSYDDGGNWSVVESYTAATEKNIESASRDFVYRLNCSAYTSGTANYYLGAHYLKR